MALSGSCLDDVVRSELKNEWEKEKENWFPSVDNYAYDLREPGNLHNTYVLHPFCDFLVTQINTNYDPTFFIVQLFQVYSKSSGKVRVS